MKRFNNVIIHDVLKLNSAKKYNEWRNLSETIYLNQDEDYDCGSLNVWSYRNAPDIREGINIKFGNMCGGFPFVLNGVPFNHSEGAYIAGAYSCNNADCIRIQNELSLDPHGYLCKKKYRRQPEFTKHIRKDWYTYNVQWMMYVIWQKCLYNNDFALLMKKIPVDAHIVENTSWLHGSTTTFWGAKNKDLRAAREAVQSIVHKYGNFKTNKAREYAKMLEANDVNKIGHFIGKNVMGKIIKICSLALYYESEPPIDNELLENKQLYLVGKRLNFK